MPTAVHNKQTHIVDTSKNRTTHCGKDTGVDTMDGQISDAVGIEEFLEDIRERNDLPELCEECENSVHNKYLD